MLTWAVVAFLTMWAVVSLLAQVPRLGARLWRRDLFGLLPNWKFFAPIPGKGDFHFLFRDRYEDVFTEWTEVRVGKARRWWNCIWNPHRRDRKAALDAAQQLLQQTRTVEESEIYLTVPYLALLTYISSLPRTFLPKETQFTVFYSDSGVNAGVPQMSFVSHVHPLSDNNTSPQNEARVAIAWEQRGMIPRETD